MKSTPIFLLLLFTNLLKPADSTGQVSRNYAGGSDFVTINNSTLPINSLHIIDSLGAGNQQVHTASFEIRISGNEQVKKMLTELQSSLQNEKSFSLIFSKANIQFSVMEQRNYSVAKVNEIALSSLAGAGKDAVTANVTIQAEQVVIIYDKGEKINNALSTKAGIAVASNYKFELDGLLTNKVSQISGLQIGTIPGGVQRFFIEIPSSDAQTWYDWFNNAKGGNNKKTARVALLSPDLRAEIFSLDLTNVEIISLSVQSSSNQESISRTKIGLRTSGVMIK